MGHGDLAHEMMKGELSEVFEIEKEKKPVTETEVARSWSILLVTGFCHSEETKYSSPYLAISPLPPEYLASFWG